MSLVDNDDIVITGLGVMLPGATNVHDFWANLRDGRSQVSRLSDQLGAGLPVNVAAQLGELDYREFLPELSDAHMKKYSREMLATMSALVAARNDAAPDASLDPDRIGFIDSSSRGPSEYWYQHSLAHTRQDRDDIPLGDPMMAGLPGSAASFAAIYAGIRGLVTTLSSACVGGNHALSLAARELRSGAADAMFVGGHEFAVIPNVLRLYSEPGRAVLSYADDPATAMRPYDKDRDGFVLGEGAIVLCLERESSALRRGARVYAKVLGHQHINEAAHPTRMDLSGQVTATMMERLLKTARIAPSEVGYICGHGTATRYNDLAESRSVGLIWDRPGLTRPALGSIKPIYGHLFGGASVLNVASTAMMLHHQTLAPTINCDIPDPECDHDHVAEGARATSLDVALSLSFAIGSQSSAVALGRA